MPELSHDIMARDYPVLYQSMFQLVHTTGERINTFGCPGYFRLSYCVSNDMIRRSLPAFRAMMEECR